MTKITERLGEISALTIQDIFEKKEYLLIVDKLDKVSKLTV